MKHVYRGILLLCAVFRCSFTPAIAQQIESFSIPEFVEINNQWTSYVGKTLKLEGRYSSFIRSGMRFEKCNLNCQFVEQIDRPLGRSRVVEVVGRLEKVAGNLVYNITSLTTLDEDTTRFMLKKRVLAEHDLNRRRELVQWGLKRGTFYDDLELKRLAWQLALEIAAFERTQLGFTVEKFHDQLLSLRQLGVPSSQLEPLYFELFLNQLAQSNLSLQQAHQIRAEVLTQLPGSAIPLTPRQGQPLPEVWTVDQAREQAGRYASATQSELAVITRQLNRMIVIRYILPKTSQSSPAEIAELASWLEQQLPEETARVEQLRTRALETKLSLIGTATKPELLKLVEQYKADGQKELAQTAINLWLTQQRKSIDPRDISRRLQLVDDYLLLAQDRNSSEQLLVEIARQHPENAEVGRRMQARNYLLVEGVWTEKQALSAEEEQIAQALRHGIAAPGMTDDQLRQSMGAPTSITRVLTRGGQQLTWYYRDSGTMVMLETEGARTRVSRVVEIPK